MTDLEERILKLEGDMYFGRDKNNPSVMTRLALLEDVISSMKTIKWLLGGAIATAIINIFSTHLSFKL